jgi:hypothetical protein
MSRDIFLHLVDVVCAFDPWFVQRRDALGKLDVSSLKKCTAALDAQLMHVMNISELVIRSLEALDCGYSCLF